MKNQSSIVIGLFLILLGVCFLFLQFFPALGIFVNFEFLWPLIPLAIGIIFLTFGLLNTPRLMIAGAILTGIGTNLLIYNTWNLWGFWQLWLLVPAFVGLGVMLATWRAGRGLRRGIAAGGWPLTIGLVLFGSFTLTHLPFFQIGWPVILIAVGLLWLLRTLMSGRRTTR